MRIPSGTTDQVIYFVAVDATDYVTFETGLSSFTVYRARNGAAAAAFTTPTITQVSSANMPGVYALLLDEDMTIDAGNDEEEVVLRITHAGMMPVTLKYELYRPKVTVGETLAVSAGRADADVLYWNASAVATPDTAGHPKVTLKAGTGAGELNFAAGRVSADVSRWAGTSVATPTVAGIPQVEVVDANAAGKADIANAVWDETNGIETGYSPRAAMKLMSAVLAGELLISAGTYTYRNLADTANRVVASVDITGRPAMTLTP